MIFFLLLDLILGGRCNSFSTCAADNLVGSPALVSSSPSSSSPLSSYVFLPLIDFFFFFHLFFFLYCFPDFAQAFWSFFFFSFFTAGQGGRQCVAGASSFVPFVGLALSRSTRILHQLVEGKSFGGSKDSSTLWLSLSFIGPLGSFFDKS